MSILGNVVGGTCSIAAVLRNRLQYSCVLSLQCLVMLHKYVLVNAFLSMTV